MHIETDIEQVRELAEAKEDQNWRFRTFLKGVDLSVKELDSIAHRHYKDIARQIDCGTCANCCTVYDARPDDCRSFPHLHKDEFVFRLIQVVNNCSVCQIVYTTYSSGSKRNCGTLRGFMCEVREVRDVHK